MMLPWPTRHLYRVTKLNYSQAWIYRKARQQDLEQRQPEERVFLAVDQPIYIAVQFVRKFLSEKIRTPGSMLIKQKKAIRVLEEQDILKKAGPIMSRNSSKLEGEESRQKWNAHSIKPFLSEGIANPRMRVPGGIHCGGTRRTMRTYCGVRRVRSDMEGIFTRVASLKSTVMVNT